MLTTKQSYINYVQISKMEEYKKIKLFQIVIFIYVVFISLSLREVNEIFPKAKNSLCFIYNGLLYY